MMGSPAQIQAVGVGEREARAAIAAGFAAMAELEKHAHPDWDDSDIHRLNANAGGAPLVVHDEIFDMMRVAAEVSEQTHGAFDVTFAGVGKLWHIQDPENFRVPSDDEIKQAMANVGWRGLELDAPTKTARLARPGMRVGLGAIGKGWAAQLGLAAMKKAGVANAIVNAGGKMAIGGDKLGQPWRVAIQHPRKARDAPIAVLEIRGDQAVITSGDYERFVMRDGIRYNHILDARTGRPTDPCQSVTTVGPHAGVANALAAAAFILGPDEGLAMLAAHYPDYEALIVDADGKIRKSAKFDAKAKVTIIE